jgi:hypothetical protein
MSRKKIYGPEKKIHIINIEQSFFLIYGKNFSCGTQKLRFKLYKAKWLMRDIKPQKHFKIRKATTVNYLVSLVSD